MLDQLQGSYGGRFLPNVVILHLKWSQQILLMGSSLICLVTWKP